MREECYWVRKKAEGIGLFLDKDDGVASARSYLAVPSRVSNRGGARCILGYAGEYPIFLQNSVDYRKILMILMKTMTILTK